MSKKKVFISYHHDNDQNYKNQLIKFNLAHDIFENVSVDTGDISDDLESQRIREIIRDDYLQDSTVTIVLIGTETKGRKHVDWEIYSSMINGKVNKRSGILVINLPTINCEYYTASLEGEKDILYPGEENWISIKDRSKYEQRYPHMPDRIIDNLLNEKARISVVNWNKIISDRSFLRFLIEKTSDQRLDNEYDLSRKMRRSNSPRKGLRW
ncbi:TIR domain-containing protein [Gracilimonas sediminicola]|uniref:TIR domain-containing protein n=1 Tax=Gracilimonas sediminicola TaxID=2952158 RepID=A0A9X2L3S9_9BACT|nr:TIR domain-containing protein [Gracilimonas sediminicola]MCP9291811.1 TIR domain-containing protein [Gracilimonas sediminicola]